MILKVKTKHLWSINNELISWAKVNWTNQQRNIKHLLVKYILYLYMYESEYSKSVVKVLDP